MAAGQRRPWGECCRGWIADGLAAKGGLKCSRRLQPVSSFMEERGLKPATTFKPSLFKRRRQAVHRFAKYAI